MTLKVSNIKRVGGAIALDFANSIDWRLSDSPHDWLGGYADILDWAKSAGCLSASQRTALVKLAKQHRNEAATMFGRLITLREAIDRIARTTARKKPPAKADLEILNDALSECPPREKLIHARGSFDWQQPKVALATPLWVIAWSAADLLSGQDRERIKICAADDCGWLFVDRSRNIARRWCSMSDCGNRDKARRFYARHKATA